MIARGARPSARDVAHKDAALVTARLGALIVDHSSRLPAPRQRRADHVSCRAIVSACAVLLILTVLGPRLHVTLITLCSTNEQEVASTEQRRSQPLNTKPQCTQALSV